MAQDELPPWLEEIPTDAAQSRETFARFGQAMYYAQCVEKQLAILLATTFNREFLKASTDERGKCFDRMLERNLGSLLGMLRQQVVVEAGTEDRLTKAKDRRNWLAHNYFLERGIDVLTWNGRERTIAELQTIADEFRLLDEQLTRLTEDWLERSGVDKGTLYAEVERYMRP